MLATFRSHTYDSQSISIHMRFPYLLNKALQSAVFSLYPAIVVKTCRKIESITRRIGLGITRFFCYKLLPSEILILKGNLINLELFEHIAILIK